MSQKLRLLSLGKSHIWGADLQEEQTSYTKPPIKTGITKEKDHK
jgi:hypothetical protein